jgi:pSer/pThr/pTyr-binding forkhead associated (FHA) protein
MWELHMGPRTWRVGPTGAVIGRSAECEISIADPSVSRRHAVLQITGGGELSIEDPGSRHGTRVNGTLLTGPMTLKHGDRLAISEHHFLVLETSRLGRERASTKKLAAVDPAMARTSQGIPRAPRRDEATGEVEPSAMMLAAADDAIARGDTAACERNLAPILAEALTAERSGGADPALVRRFATCALRAASTLGRVDWIASVVDLHGVRPRVMHAATIDALEGALERMPTYDRTKLTRYVREIRTREATLGTYEKFCLERLINLGAAP